jgi:hypothetical protein
LELDTRFPFKAQITINLIRIFRHDSVLRLKKNRRLYLISEETNRWVQSQGIQTIPVTFTSPNQKKFVFYRVLLEVHRFY